VRVSFWSAITIDRNRPLLETIRLSDERTAWGIAHQVLSLEDYPLGNDSKDLRQVRDIDLQRVILFDDQDGNAHIDQTGNVLIFPDVNMMGLKPASLVEESTAGYDVDIRFAPYFADVFSYQDDYEYQNMVYYYRFARSKALAIAGVLHRLLTAEAATPGSLLATLAALKGYQDVLNFAETEGLWGEGLAQLQPFDSTLVLPQLSWATDERMTSSKIEEIENRRARISMGELIWEGTGGNWAFIPPKPTHCR